MKRVYNQRQTQIRHLRAMRAGLERILAVHRGPVCRNKNRKENQKDGKTVLLAETSGRLFRR